jgi:hypothetical protein
VEHSLTDLLRQRIYGLATITTAVRLVELEMYWLAALFRKDQTLCYFSVCSSAIPFNCSFFAATLQQTRNYRWAFFMNYPG